MSLVIIPALLAAIQENGKRCCSKEAQSQVRRYCLQIADLAEAPEIRPGESLATPEGITLKP